ncbi:MAG: GAF domain-containing protein [Deltaproteobacteria bacterium]|nr:GAF domain-containing protein [Deltaproteobacteria bacterium]
MEKIESRDSIYHQELYTILRFGALINSSLHIEDVLNYAMKWAEEFIQAEASTIYELDEENQELFIRLARGEKKDQIQNIRLSVGEGIAGRVVLTGQPMVVQDVSKEPCFSDKFDRISGYQTRSMICVPLIIRDRPMGVIAVLNKRSKEGFSQADLLLLTSMAQQIAVAMENAKLYHRLEEKFELTTQELKTAQEKLIRSERLTAIGHLIQGIAHELRNPLTTIGGFANRIKSEFTNNERIHQYIDIILEETDRLERLVQQVKKFSKIQSAILKPSKIQTVIENVLKRFHPLALEQDVNIITHTEPALPEINMDIPQMTMAISNIMENALEAMPSGGTIEIKTNRDEDNILLEVKDTGIGISSDQMDSVYDPFFTSKTSGAGLGLTMVHQIIMNHEGEIHIASEVLKGTTVTIRLPILRK